MTSTNGEVRTQRLTSVELIDQLQGQGVHGMQIWRITGHRRPHGACADASVGYVLTPVATMMPDPKDLRLMWASIDTIERVDIGLLAHGWEEPRRDPL